MTDVEIKQNMTGQVLQWFETSLKDILSQHIMRVTQNQLVEISTLVKKLFSLRYSDQY